MIAKIRYIEVKPIQQSIDFESREDWEKFYIQRLKELIDYTYTNHLDFHDYFVYQRVLLNKDGTPRKSIHPIWLNTKKSRKKQKKNWEEWLERKKKLTAKSNLIRKKAELQGRIDVYEKQLQELDKEEGKEVSQSI
jgi:hypothetical protein